MQATVPSRLPAWQNAACPLSTYSGGQTVLCRSGDFTPGLPSPPTVRTLRGPGLHSPAACRCSRASLSMLKGSLGASRRSQEGHTEAPGHLFDALVGEGVMAAAAAAAAAARAACSGSIWDPTPIFKESLGPLPVRDRKGRGEEMRRLDWGRKRETGFQRTVWFEEESLHCRNYEK